MRRQDQMGSLLQDSENRSPFYRKSQEPQITDRQQLTKTARIQQVVDIRRQEALASPGRSRINYEMNHKYFGSSNVFENERKYEEPKQEIKDVENRDNRFTAGGQSNKGYNTKVVQHKPIDNKSMTLDFTAKDIDELEVKRQLLKQGLHVIELQMSNPLYQGAKKQTGKMTVRGLDEKLKTLPDNLEKLGVKTNQNQTTHGKTIPEKTWLGQKIAYAKIGYFGQK
ncbi:hypothetical protein pb186bvf_018829 [Paramecium bursaria]